MKDEKIYYKISQPTYVMLFYHDLENDRLDGIIEETKTENKFTVQKHLSVSCYDNVVGNTLAQSMIKKAKIIDDTEYEIAKTVASSFMSSPDWLIADNDYQKEQKEVVTETIYV